MPSTAEMVETGSWGRPARVSAAADAPGDARLAPPSAGGAVLDQHPALVGRRSRAQRAQGQRLQAAGDARVAVGAGLRLGVALDGAVERCPVPAQQLDAGLKAGVLERCVDVRDEVVGRPVGVGVALDQKADGGHVAAVGVGQLVDGVEVAQRAKHARELGVELQFAERIHAPLQQRQSLHGIDGVHRALER
jgi:hypothetical protein